MSAKSMQRFRGTLQDQYCQSSCMAVVLSSKDGQADFPTSKNLVLGSYKLLACMPSPLYIVTPGQCELANCPVKPGRVSSNVTRACELTRCICAGGASLSSICRMQCSEYCERRLSMSSPAPACVRSEEVHMEPRLHICTTKVISGWRPPMGWQRLSG